MPPRGRSTRILVFWLAAIAGMVAPVAAGMLGAFLGPSPYLLDESRVGAGWAAPVRFPDGSVVVVRSYASPDEASAEARSVGESIPASSRSQTLSVLRYTREDDRRRGLLLPVDRHLVHIEAADDDGIDRRLGSLPFLRENPDTNPVWVLFADQPGVALAGLALYALVFLYAMARGAAWAARIAPAPRSSPVTADRLRSRILALNDLDLPFHVRQEPGGRLVAEWRIADERWVGLLEAEGLREAHWVHMELDAGAHRVRSLDVHRTVSWSAGAAEVSGSFSLFRGITFHHYERGVERGLFFRNGRWTTKAYDYRFLLSEMKTPLVEVITGSGWHFAPVLALPRTRSGVPA